MAFACVKIHLHTHVLQRIYLCCKHKKKTISVGVKLYLCCCYVLFLKGPQVGPARKNRPLCHETIRWRSDVPLTEGQLRSKRDEFWDTAPAFDGRKEIWDALRAATTAAEGLDFQLAQAILDGANVSVPNG